MTFEDREGKTLLAVHEIYPSKDALNAAGTGASDPMPEQFDQLDALLVSVGAGVGGS